MATNGGEIATAPRPTEAISRWSPFEEFGDIRHRMEDLFTHAFGYTPLSRMLPSEPYTFDPPVDLFETDDRFEAFISVPGFTRDMITVNAAADTLSISGERKTLYDEKEKATARRHGWVTGSCCFDVSYTLPSEIDPKKIKATFKDGVLHVELPKSERATAKLVKVKVEPA